MRLACLHTCLSAWHAYTYIHTYRYIPTYLPTYIHTYRHTHTHAVGSVLVRVHVHACRHVRMDGVLRSSAEVDVLWQAATCDLRLRLKESAQLEDVAVQPSLNSAEARPLSRRSRSFVPKLLLANLLLLLLRAPTAKCPSASENAETQGRNLTKSHKE